MSSFPVCTQKDLAGPWLDGELADTEAAAFEAHLESCEECSGEAAALRSLLEEARRLPRQVAPPRDLWLDIEERLADVRDNCRHEVGPQERRWGWQKKGFLAAAAVLIAALSLGLLMERTPAPDLPRVAEGEPSVSDPRPEDRLPVSPANALAAAFDTTLRQLLLELARQGGGEPTEAQRVVLNNLNIMEMATTEIRSALREEPLNRRLQRQLAASYQKQVELLTLATRLAQT